MEEVEKNPALRLQMHLDAQRKFEAQQDDVFQWMQDRELLGIFHSGTMEVEIQAHKRFWAWRKQAVSEMQQLRETQKLNSDTFTRRIEKLTWEPADIEEDTGERRISVTLKCPMDFANVLPITTPVAFRARQHYTSDRRPWFRSGTEGKASTGRPPGKRFSFCEMPQIQCKPEHYRWLRESVGLRLVKGLSYDDQAPQSRLGLWTQLTKLMWKGEVATSHTAKNNKQTLASIACIH